MTNSAIIALAAAIAIAISTLGPAIGQGLTAKAAATLKPPLARM